MSKNTLKNQYSADSIQALEGMEHVRKRPSMYIGDVGSRGLHHLVYEVVDNSIDEAMAGYCSSIKIEINKDFSLTVEDDGRGIPVGMHKKEGVSALEVVMTKIGAGGKFDKDSYKVSGGLHGVGVSVVNALSEWLELTIKRDKNEYFMQFKDGVAVAPLQKIGSSETIKQKSVDRKKDYKNILNLEDLIGFVESLEQEKWLSVDLETTSVNPMAAEIVGFSFSTKKDTGFYVPILFKDKKENLFGNNDLEEVIRILKPYLEDENIPKTGQNIKYDALILKRYGIELKGIEFDTMIAAHLLNLSLIHI